MDPIKEAFDKIKQDILFLKEEMINLSSKIDFLSQESIKTTQQIQIINSLIIPTIPTHNISNQDPLVSTPTHNPTDQFSLEHPKEADIELSTGNRGVPTDKPTDRQTNQQTDKTPIKSSYNLKESFVEDSINSFEKASEILGSLDVIKKEIRLKFKRLTPQEMLIFSTLYSLEEQDVGDITYKIIAQNLRLSESSIRDYITKIKSKGIPVQKKRLNNKQISLKISADLKKITNLSTILKLRDL